MGRTTNIRSVAHSVSQHFSGPVVGINPIHGLFLFSPMKFSVSETGFPALDVSVMLAYHANISAELVLHEKITDESGNTIEMKNWRVSPSIHMPHGFKYSLVYIVGGERIIGYDNAERRGGHRHFRGAETKYVFRSVRQLVQDFQADVARYKERSHES